MAKDSLYNKTSLPKNVVENLKHEFCFIFGHQKRKIINEEYFGEYNAKSKTNSFSMAKAFTVMLMGAAIKIN